jgi:hypothetical protein
VGLFYHGTSGTASHRRLNGLGHATYRTWQGASDLIEINLAKPGGGLARQSMLQAIALFVPMRLAR